MTTMKVLTPTVENIETVADCILGGGVVVTPSDTNLALTVDPWNETAIERAFTIKNRAPTDPLTLFIHDPEEWKTWGSLTEPALVESLINEFWPGPLNLIVNKTNAVPDRVVAGGDTVSIGCLRNPTWRKLAQATDIPLCMTSANKTGQADGQLVDLEMACEQVGDEVDYILNGEAQGTTQSSTIVDLTGTPSVLRHGDISVEQLNAVIDVFSSP